MTHRPISQRWLDRWFQLILIFKGLNGILELIGGTILLAIPSHALREWITTVSAHRVIVENDTLTHAVTSLGHTLTPGTQLYTAIYLLLHGIIKVGLVAALLSRRYQWYPWAIGVLIAFMLYQIYRIVFEHQIVFDTTLTLIDAVVVWLTIVEYRRHRHPERLLS